jgi:hypothetical protein
LKLWTYQGFDFSLIDGAVDHCRSEFVADVPNIKAAYAELSKRLNTDQIVWCLPKPEPELWKRRIEWHLEVPPAAFLAILDPHAWCKLLGQRYAPPESLRLKWRVESIQQAPYDATAREALRQQWQAAYDKSESIDTLWGRVFVKEVVEGSNVLLRHPLDPNWVISSASAIDQAKPKVLRRRLRPK